MGSRIERAVVKVAFAFLVVSSMGASCVGGAGAPAAVSGSVGGLVLVVRTFEATADPDLRAIDRVEIVTSRVELDHSFGRLVVDAQHRTIVLRNDAQSDELVAHYQVPVGLVSRIRIFPSAVTIYLKTGATIPLEVPSSALPSWDQSGWKIEPDDGIVWSIVENAFTGARIIFRFDERMLHNSGVGYKLRPTAPAARFTEADAMADRRACYDRLIAIETEIVGHVLALESSTPCASDADCTVVPVETSCLKACPNVIAGADLAELNRRLAASDATNCRKPIGCTLSSLCAQTTAVCSTGRCRARWEGIVP